MLLADAASSTAATPPPNYLRDYLQDAGYNVFTGAQGDVRIFLAGLIKTALSMVGVIFFLMILYGGFLWLTAGGNAEKVSKARTLVFSAVIGFMVTLAALMITRFVAGILEVSTSTGGGQATSTGTVFEGSGNFLPPGWGF